MAEYIFTNLPQYINITPRTAFSNSVVQANHVLLLSEDGTSVIAKQPNGSFVSVGGSVAFYKCASVDTSNHKWTGYKAYLDDGVYKYESTLTADLTYSMVTPIVGQVYADGALIRASLYEGLPMDGLVFYAPLSASAATAETGHDLTYSGTFSFSTYKNIPSINLQNACIDTSIISASSMTNFALSLWFLNNDWTATAIFQQLGGWGEGHYWGLNTNNGAAQMQYQPGNASGVTGTRTDLQSDHWYHLVLQRGNDTASAFIDGVLDMSASSLSSAQSSNMAMCLGAANSNPSLYPLNGRIAAVRIYNRTLTNQEIATLAAEFTPNNTHLQEIEE